MPVRVVDASALGALVFGEPKAGEMANALSTGTIAAPALLWFELATIALRKMVIHPKQKDQILNAFQLGRHLAIEVVEVDHSEVIELAGKAGLTSYDATYLWLALHLGGELVTLDRKLMKAASQQY